jgi:anthranilate synthase component 1
MSGLHSPSLAEVRGLTGEGNVVPVFREANADLETPVSAYLKVARGPYSFLLESVEGGERLGRYSFIGTDPFRVLTCPASGEMGDPLRHVEAELAGFQPVPVPGLPALTGGAIGFLSYDAVRHFEPRVKLPDGPGLGLPDALFMFNDTLLVFDHLRHCIKVISHCRLDGDIEANYCTATRKIDSLVARLDCPLVLPHEDVASVTAGDGRFTSNIEREDYLNIVDQIKDYVVQGDVIQVVNSQRLSRRTGASPFGIYRQLRAINPSPYMFYLQAGDFQVLGASPELLVKVEDGRVINHPIAGTKPRGRDAAEDDAIAAELLADEKERAEHIMLVDLGRNDVGRVSEPGSVRVDSLMHIERYSHVMHIVSHVSGQLASGKTSYDAVRACFPAGTVSGAPKVRAMEIISEVEPDRRGVYAGAIGYFSFSGNLDTCIAIRTMVVKDGVAHVQAGGGIVYDSDPGSEYQETLNKAGALLRAIDQAELAAATQRPAEK